LKEGSLRSKHYYNATIASFSDSDYYSVKKRFRNNVFSSVLVKCFAVAAELADRIMR